MSKLKFPEDALRATIPELHKVCKVVASSAQATLPAVFVSALAYINHPSQMRFRGSFRTISNLSSSLIALMVAETGERKDTVDNFFNRSQRDFQSNLEQKYTADKENNKKEMLAYQHKLKTEPKTSYIPSPATILIPSIITSAPTREGVMRSINLGYPFHSIFSTEGGTFFNGYANNKENSIATLSTLCTMKQGRFSADAKASDLTQEKIDKGEIRLRAENIAFSMYMAMQPLIFNGLLSDNNAEEQGFLGRCLIVKPESLAGKRFTDSNCIPQHELDSTLAKFHTGLSRLYKPEYIEETDPKSGLRFKEMRVHPDDEQLFCEFLDHFELYTTKNTAFHYIAPFLKRRVEHVLSIAVTLQTFVNSDTGYISTTILKLAIELFQFFASEANTAVHEAKSKKKKEKVRHEIVKFMDYLKKGLVRNTKWIEGSFKIGTALFRGVARNMPSDRIRELTERLIELNLITRVDEQTYEFTDINIENNCVIVDSEYHSEPFPYFSTTPQIEPNDPEDEEDIPVHISPDVGPITYSTTEVSNYSDNRDQIDLIRTRINLSDYIGNHVILKRGMGLCPFHTEKTPSFSVRPEFFKCFGCDAKGDIYDFISMHKNLSITDSFPQILAIAADYAGVELENKQYSVTYEENPQAILERNKRWEKEKAETLAKYEPEKEQSRLLAKSIYESGIYIDAPYLSKRCGTKIVTPLGFRFLKEYYHTEEKKNYPVMIAGLIKDGNFTGVHLTFLDKNGEKKAAISPNKKFIGTSKGAHIPLYSPFDGDTLIISEGIETGISAWNIITGKDDLVACFAAGAGYNMAELSVPTKFTKIIIAGDNGEAGRNYAEAARQTYEKQGFKVSTVYPPEKFGDFNDWELFNNKNSI